MLVYQRVYHVTIRNSFFHPSSKDVGSAFLACLAAAASDASHADCRIVTAHHWLAPARESAARS